MRKRTIALFGTVALTLSACGDGGGEGPAPGSDGGSAEGDREVVIGSFGGDTDEFMRQSTHTFLDEYGDVEPTLDGADSPTRLTRLMTEAEGDSGSWDIVAVTDRDVPDLVENGLFQELDTDQISQWENIDSSLVNDHCVPQMYSPITAIYNDDEMDLELDSWESVFSDEFLGVSAVAPPWEDYFFWASAILEAGGDPGSDLEPGYERVADIASEPLEYGSPTQMGQGLMAGEVQTTLGSRARAAQWSSESGTEFASVIPEEGTFRTAFYYCIPENANNVEAAHDYLDAMLDPRSQQHLAENFFHAPSVTNAELDQELQDAIGVTDEEANRIWNPDLGQIAEQTPEIRSLWSDNS